MPTRRPRTITMRASLFISLVLLVLFICGSLLLLGFSGARRAREALSQELVDTTTETVKLKLDAFFAPVRQTLAVSPQWAAAGAVTVDDEHAFAAVYTPVIRHAEMISAISTGDAAGRGLTLMRHDGAWRIREMHRDARGDEARWTHFDERGQVVRTWTDTANYDPRTRPWYIKKSSNGSDSTTDGESDKTRGDESSVPLSAPTAAASARDPVAAAPITWTEPYPFYTGQAPGLTASTRVTGPDDESFVIAVDVLLAEVSRFTTTLNVGKHGVVFITVDDGRVIGLPAIKPFTDAEARRAGMLKTIDELNVPIMTDGAAAWEAHGAKLEDTYRFESGGEAWWVGVRTYALGNQRLRIVTAIPEAQMLGQLDEQQSRIIVIAACSVLVAALIAVLLARWYSKPISDLAAASERLRGLDLTATREPVVTWLREVNQLADAQDRMRAALQSFASYVPTEIVRELLHRGEAARIGGRTADVTVLFTDIDGFTGIAETMSPQAVTDHMSTYFSEMIHLIREHGGTIDKLVGDAIVAFWGAPKSVADHARRACDAVVACRARLAALNDEWDKHGLPRLPTRFGLASGPALVGNVGAPSRMHYTVIGDTANLASRLEGVNVIYGTRVLASATTKQQAGDEFAWRLINRVSVSGRSGADEVYELLGKTANVDAARLEYASRFEEAVRAYWQRKFDAALAILRELEKEQPGDTALLRLKEHCEQFLTDPPDAAWNGVVQLFSKRGDPPPG